ncbi:MAG TPA: hypothetical protein VM864_15480 [Pyrinomonadaceae bacterium]|jgi:hypothetical protein|nr:hypothetical protein [Pyrinomonadaceae bacterium]
MRQRQITIEGGRYLIFYTFEDEPGLAAASPDATAARGGALDGARDEGVGAADARTARAPAARESAVEPTAEGEPRV